MSNEQAKEHHSKRLHKEEAAIKRQVEIAKAHGIEVKQPHKYAKHHALNCGQPNCVMCANPRKTFNEKTIQEKRFDQTERWEE